MTFEKALRYICLAGVFILPFLVLYVSKSLFFPFITGKNFAFRIIVEIIAGGYLTLAIMNPAYRPRRTWLFWSLSVFVLLIGISDIFGVYPHKSFWSNFERMEGWITLAHLLAYFVVAQTILNTEKLWKKWWHTSLAVSGIVAAYAFLQLMGFITINQGGIRLDATFGNATYLGVYMMFHIFIASLFLARAWVESPMQRVKNTWLYGLSIATNTFILFFTSTRGAMLGLLGGAMLSALIMIFLAPRSRVAWRAGAVIVGFAVLSGAFWLVSDQAWVHKIEPLHRLASIADEGVPDARQMNWGMAIQGFKERPILGWGQENYAPVFDKYYDPNMWGQEPWFDRVHNIIFDWLIAGGILGLLAYLSLYVAALYYIWRSGAFAPYERAILTGLLAGYFFYLVFTFDNLTSYLFFISLLAFIAARGGKDIPESNAKPLPKGALPLVAAGTIALTCGMLWYVNADAIAQNRAIIQGLMPQAGGITKNLEYMNKAVSYNSVGNQETAEQFSQAAISILGIQGVPDTVKRDFITSAHGAMTMLSEDSPLYARFPLFMGLMLDQAGAYEDAKVSLQKARELSPHKQSILFESGLNAFARNQNDESVGYFKTAYELAPEFADAQIYYIAALVRAGRDAEVDPLLQPLIANDTAADPRIAAALAARGRNDIVAAIWQAHVAKKPDDLNARVILANAYYSDKKSTEALRVLEEAKALFPGSASQIDILMQQIREGKPLQ